METVRRTRANLPAETALIGFAGSPATVACYMLDGKGGGFPRTRALAYENPAFVEGVIEILIAGTIQYLQAQIDAGANVVMLFESWSGIFPPEQFRKFVIAPTKQIVTALKSANPGLKIIGFPRLCGLLAGRICAGNRRRRRRAGHRHGSRRRHCRLPAGHGLPGQSRPAAAQTGGAALDDAAQKLLHAFQRPARISSISAMASRRTYRPSMSPSC